MAYIADTFHEGPAEQQAPDTLLALGLRMEAATAVFYKADQANDFDASKAALAAIGVLRDEILRTKAAGLDGIAVQIRMLNHYFDPVFEHKGYDEDLFVAAIQSIADVLDKHLGIGRKRFGGDFFLPS